ncbi:MAG: Lpg1974 family pore-forming outer membrane protein [Chlamydiota bacterium]|jgi:hypothetical protein
MLKWILTLSFTFYTLSHADDLKASYNAGYKVEVHQGWDLFLKGSFIWWQARQEGMELAITQPQGTSLPIDSTVIQMKYKYKPGFQVLAGYKSTYDDWQFSAAYTWLYFTERQFSAAPNAPIGNLKPLWLNTSTAANTTSSKWRLSLNLVDANLVREFFVSKKFLFSSFAGLRASIIDQEYNVSYTYSNLSPTSKNNSDSWGLGTRLGLRAKWMLGEGFSIFAKTFGSLLYTKFDLKNVQRQVENPSIINIQAKDTVKALTPNAEFALGFDWGSFFADRKWYVDFAVSYDFQVFFNQNRMALFADEFFFSTSKELSNLYLHGLTVSGRIDF